MGDRWAGRLVLEGDEVGGETVGGAIVGGRSEGHFGSMSLVESVSGPRAGGVWW